MEYDNDRIVKGTSRTELFCWLVFFLINPVVNMLGIFHYQRATWIILLLSSLFMLPVYIFFARFLAVQILFKGKYLLFAGLTVLFFFSAHLLLFLLYKFESVFVPNGSAAYFSYSDLTFERESAWILIQICLATAIGFIRKKGEEDEAVDSLQKENTWYKLRYFRSQLNPHFLFNTLNSIYSMSMNKSDKTPEVVVKLADIMRFLIYECNEDKIPLEKEIEFIRNYIDIERIRYDADIQFTIEGNTDGVMIEPFLFISFIENGFKHAIDNSFARPFIYIKLKVNPGEITLNVINNTSLELETQAKKMQGKGLVNSKSVLELLYPHAYELDIIQTENKNRKESKIRLKNAQERLQKLYPDSHTLDVILSNNTFTVSLILLTGAIDKVYNYRR